MRKMIYRLLMPQLVGKKWNSFSGHFYRWKHERTREIIEAQIKTSSFNRRYNMYEVQGSKGLAVSKGSGYSCGTARGFSVDFPFESGYCGGVMDEKEAIRLAKHILKVCKK